ncbi:hypothetical protein [Nonomuraea sp. KM88]|uniref:hypothetical protein n=1 Tax=Nonomuraea sp. KM88 TaxID=3457427 RepID=UPI003FCD0575
MGAPSELGISAGQRGEFGDAQPGLHGDEQQQVVPAAQRGGLVGNREERVTLGAGQEAHVGGITALVRDGQDALDEQGMFGATQRRVAEQGVDRGQPGVASGDAVVPVGLEMVQEAADEVGIDVGQVQGCSLDPVPTTSCCTRSHTCMLTARISVASRKRAG